MVAPADEGRAAAKVAQTERYPTVGVFAPRDDIGAEAADAFAEEAQRLGRVLRPKADGRAARFYAIVARDTVDQDFAQHRQRFLAEQGYGYTIVDADDLPASDPEPSDEA